MSHAPRRVLLLLVRGYRLLFSAWLGGACRFEPTCSVYALGAIERHGARVGGALAGGRLLRCRPGCTGGHDPVPDAPEGWLGRLVAADRHLLQRHAASPARPSSGINP